MGSVYAAHDESLDTPVAVKIIKPEFASREEFTTRFKREVLIARELQHPHIIRIFEYGQTTIEGAELHYFVMELLQGQDLAEWKYDRSLSLRQILRISRELCSALGAAHEKRIVHRDLKPANIFIDAGGHIKLMDFGISRLDSRTKVTIGNPRLLGTPVYMSPEQVSGTNVDHRSDIYSVGVVLYELCTGQVPFLSDDLIALVNQHVHADPVPPTRIDSTIPGRLEELILTCLEKRPLDRFQNVEELERALDAVETAEPLFSFRSRVDSPSADAGDPRSESRGVVSDPVHDVEPHIEALVAGDDRATVRRRTGRRRKSSVLAFAVLAVAAVVVGYFLASLRGPSETTIASQDGPVTEPSEEPSASGKPAPPVPAPPPTGSLEVLANADGVRVYVEGNAVDGPPYRTDELLPESYRVRVEKEGYAPFERDVIVRAGQPTMLEVTLTERRRESPPSPPTTGSLIVRPSEQGALVYLDGNAVRGPPYRAENLVPRSYRIRVEKDGYMPYTGDVDVGAGEPTTIEASLIPTSEASYEMGENYFYGRSGYAQDDAEAVKWYRQAAEQGYARGQVSLGGMYESGRGVVKDEAEALRWYRQAAERGHAPGQEKLASMYEEGRGVAKDEAEAVRWYRKAAEQGYAPGQNNLGVMYEDGRGVAKNEAEAAIWYRKAAQQGHAPGQSNLGIMYSYGRGVSKDDGEAVKWYRQAAEQGLATGQYNLGFMYERGRGVTRNDREAVKWYRLAAEQGYVLGQYNLAFMYEKGRGVARDDREAAAWYRKAADQGFARAETALRRLGSKDEQCGST